MSYNTYLITTNTPGKPTFTSVPPSERLFWASTSIPVFWYMLFDEASLVSTTDPNRANKPEYAHLSKPAPEAITLARSRWDQVRIVLGPQNDELFALWLACTEAHAKEHLHCETQELQVIFTSEEDFESELQTCLEAFSHYPAKGQGKLNKWWLKLLGQAAALGEGDCILPYRTWSYCGTTWNGKPPWDEGED